MGDTRGEVDVRGDASGDGKGDRANEYCASEGDDAVARDLGKVLVGVVGTDIDENSPWAVFG